MLLGGIKNNLLQINEYKAFVIQEQDFFHCAGDYENETLEYAEGLYYFECEMTVGKDNNLADWTNVGIGTDSQEGMIDFYLVGGRDGDYGYGAIYNTLASTNITKSLNPINSDFIKSGDIIGVAMNLDEHKVYFSLNGNWMNGSLKLCTRLNLKICLLLY